MAILISNNRTLYSLPPTGWETVPTAVSTSRWVPKKSTLGSWMRIGINLSIFFYIKGNSTSCTFPKNDLNPRQTLLKRKRASTTSSWTNSNTWNDSKPKVWSKKAEKKRLPREWPNRCSCQSPESNTKTPKNPRSTIWKVKSSIRICSRLSMISRKRFMRDFSYLCL